MLHTKIGVQRAFVSFVCPLGPKQPMLHAKLGVQRAFVSFVRPLNSPARRDPPADRRRRTLCANHRKKKGEAMRAEIPPALTRGRHKMA